ncbi:MarR family transcriptional regulator [Pseudooceanicola sediminis]|uniref:MarR family transcriptional regulator n=1 Tax=Pseudooceanicola sediminis TaxID=2211117 RepID=A0A399J2Q6_9RHOB|nr:MarR family transcriptional regulator [Pseudooceanicola sediminis]KAA2317281.1 MarR family transcriptional regulator [Puniceibacterium sp. HSS470]RII39635.1 MarR family transcriptional regulator [Pseudooceanicola sediminis]|tara:strand:+ start:12052 stop:12525 length:474 start_codon:yes stop_codon:yes gene_type:complete
MSDRQKSAAGANPDGLIPDSLRDDIGFKLRLAQILAYRAFEERVTGYGAAPRYLGLLAIIRATPGQPQSRLAEAVALQRSSLVAILDRLETDGLLERRASASDRRAKGVWLTAQGEAVTEELRLLAQQSEDRATAGLDADSRAALLKSLDCIIDNLR